jgi:hypothetical protein
MAFAARSRFIELVNYLNPALRQGLHGQPAPVLAHDLVQAP